MPMSLSEVSLEFHVLTPCVNSQAQELLQTMSQMHMRLKHKVCWCVCSRTYCVCVALVSV